MIKVIITIKCKPGLTRAQFIDYYETKHAPLGRSVFGEFFLAYKRSYPIHDDPYAFAGAFDDAAAGKPEPGFDVMTEILVKDRDTMEKMLAAEASLIGTTLFYGSSGT